MGTTPLESARNVFGVVVRVFTTWLFWSVAFAVPGVEAVLVIERKTCAPGTAVPVESLAMTSKVTASPAASEPDAAIGAAGFQAYAVTDENT